MDRRWSIIWAHKVMNTSSDCVEPTPIFSTPPPHSPNWNGVVRTMCSTPQPGCMELWGHEEPGPFVL